MLCSKQSKPISGESVNNSLDLYKQNTQVSYRYISVQNFIVYSLGILNLEEFGNAYFAGDVNTRLSTSGYIFRLNKKFIAWGS